MRCDLHVHSRRSGPVDLPGLGRFADESYSEPAAVYEEARGRGMDLVTLTDHDTIEGGLEIAHRPGTFLSEEVSCTLPGGRRLHLGVLDLLEQQHARIARLRDDAEALLAYLAEQRLPAALNHPFSALTGRREPVDLRLALDRLPLVEARNGMMSAALNACATHAGRAAGRALVAGSDAHTLASVGRAYTMVPSARTREEFLAALRRGLTIPAGRSGTYAHLTADVTRLMTKAYATAVSRAIHGYRGWARLGFMLAVLPVAAPLMPVVVAAAFAREQVFARRQFALYMDGHTGRRSWAAPRGPLGPATAATPAR